MILTSGRDRYLDALRAVAIARVVVFHMFGFAWLSYLFPSMGVMFALGGSLMAASLQRSAVRAVRSRIRRLLPAVWAMALIVVPAMFWHGWSPDDVNGRDLVQLAFWAVPLAQPPGNAWADDATVVLWYLVTYLWFVLLSPLAWWLFRRSPVLTVLLPLGLLAATQLGPFPADNRAGEVVVNLATFGACWLTGFAHRSGALRRINFALLAVLATASILAGVAWAMTHPTDQGSGNLNDIPLAQGVYSLGFVLLVLRFAPAMTWLRRARPLDATVTLLNARSVTIYLWHNIAIAVCFPVGDLLHVWQVGPTFAQLGYFAVALCLLFLVVLALGWVEDIAALRSPTLLPLGRRATHGRPAAPEPATDLQLAQGIHRVAVTARGRAPVVPPVIR